MARDQGFNSVLVLNMTSLRVLRAKRLLHPTRTAFSHLVLFNNLLIWPFLIKKCLKFFFLWHSPNDGHCDDGTFFMATTDLVQSPSVNPFFVPLAIFYSIFDFGIPLTALNEVFSLLVSFTRCKVGAKF